MSRHSIGLVVSSVVIGAILVINFYNSIHGVTFSSTAASQEAAVYHVVPSQSFGLITEPDDGINPVLTKIAEASSSVDMVMYELTDQQVEDALAAAAGRGVSVRVLLNNGLYGAGSKTNQSAYTFLKAHNVPVEWTPSYFALTHQKTLIIDNKDALIMTFNLVPKYYATGRDFAVDDTDSADVQAIEAAFNSDWQGSKAIATTGDDLVWSPGSKQELLAMISSAKQTLYIYNEEMQDPDVIAALAAAAGRGVKVEILMTDSSSWHDAFNYLQSQGAQIHVYSSYVHAPLYIHAKMIIADDTQAFLGSENFSTNSMEMNRELGLLISNKNVLSQLEQTFASDWSSATAYAQ